MSRTPYSPPYAIDPAEFARQFNRDLDELYGFAQVQHNVEKIPGVQREWPPGTGVKVLASRCPHCNQVFFIGTSESKGRHFCRICNQMGRQVWLDVERVDL